MKHLIIKILVGISKKLGYRPEDEFGMVIFLTTKKMNKEGFDIFYTKKYEKYRGATHKLIRII